MEHWLWMILAALFFECKGEDRVIQTTAEVTATEGDTVTLDCSFETTDTSPTLFWYKQEVNGFPQYMLRCFSQTVDHAPEFQKERFNAAINKTSTSVPLKIQNLQVSDSTVYYCALQPYDTGGNKIIFGSGTKLHVTDRDNYLPSYYELTDGNTKACLATGFSRYKATNDHGALKNAFNKTEATRISGDSLYNSVVLLEGAGGQCDKNTGNPNPCVDGLEQDPTVNGVTLTILGLRLLFLKTIIFNVLITLRLWISH